METGVTLQVNLFIKSTAEKSMQFVTTSSNDPLALTKESYLNVNYFIIFTANNTIEVKPIEYEYHLERKDDDNTLT